MGLHLLRLGARGFFPKNVERIEAVYCAVRIWPSVLMVKSAMFCVVAILFAGTFYLYM